MDHYYYYNINSNNNNQQFPFCHSFRFNKVHIRSLLFPIWITVFYHVSEFGASDDGSSPTNDMVLRELSNFFVDSFLKGKVNGGSPQVTKQQCNNMYQSQNAKFK